MTLSNVSAFDAFYEKNKVLSDIKSICIRKMHFYIGIKTIVNLNI